MCECRYLVLNIDGYTTGKFILRLRFMYIRAKAKVGSLPDGFVEKNAILEQKRHCFLMVLQVLQRIQLNVKIKERKAKGKFAFTFPLI